MGLIDQGRWEIADTVYREPQTRGLTRDLRDLEPAPRGAENGGQPARRIDDAGDVGKAAWLLGIVVDRVPGRRRVFDPLGILQIFASEVVIDLTNGATHSALGWSVDCEPPYIVAEPPGARVPVSVWMSIIPEVRNHIAPEGCR